MTQCTRNQMARHGRRAAATLALCTVLAGCSSLHGGYGLTGQAATEAALRQQAADKADARTTPDNQQMYLSLIREMQERDMYFASLAHIDAYKQKYGDSPDIDLLQADALRETGQDSVAEAAYRKLLSTQKAAAAWHGLGLLAGKRGDFAGAALALGRASRDDPTEPVYLSDLGYALMRSGDIAAARIPIAQAAELAPGNRKIISNLALYLVVAGQHRKADEVMDKAQLPKPTRQAIARLARDIARQPRARVASTHRVTSDPYAASSGPSAVTPGPAVVRLPDNQGSGLSAERLAPALSSANGPGAFALPMPSMLDRFANR